MAIAVAATSVGTSGGVTTTHTITLPSGNQAGDLVLIFFSNDNADTATPPPGWSTVFAAQNSGKCTLSVFSRVLVAPLASIVVTTSAAQGSCFACYRVTGFDPSLSIEAGTAVLGNTPNPDPPLLNPAGWDTGSALWIAVAGWDNPRSCTAFSMLSNQVSTFLNLSAGCGIAVSTELLTDSQYDPFAYTISKREGWVANTLAIRQSQPSATINQTLPSLTQSGSAGVAIEASVIQSLCPLGQSGSAGVSIDTDIDQSLPAITQSAVANIRIAVAIVEQVLPAITQTAGAEVVAGATVVQALPVLGQSAEATVDIAAEIIQTIPPMTQSGTADSGTTVDGEQTLPALTQSGECESVIDATVVQRLPALLQVSLVAVGVEAEAIQDLPAMTQSATANLDDGARTITAEQSMPALLQSAITSVDVGAAISQTLPSIGQAAVLATGSQASIVQRLPAMQQSAEAQVGFMAEIAQILPGIVQSGEIYNDTPPPVPRKNNSGVISAAGDRLAVFSKSNRKLVVSSTPRRQGVRAR